MKYYSYENFRDDTKILLSQVKTYEPEVIVAIARGGLIMAHCIAEGLGVRDVQTLRTELYDATKKREQITLFGECRLENISRVLVVDDIADSGETFQAVMRDLEAKNPNVEFKSASLFYKKTSCFEPDFWINDADDWIDFFWERDFHF
jgi:xanthine phosphoribosyltransferase